MRNTLFAAAAAIALVLGTAPTFAAQDNNGQKAAPAAEKQPAVSNNGNGEKVLTGGVNKNNAGAKSCAEILADRANQTPADVTKCEKP
jgi:hypothetical protein